MRDHGGPSFLMLRIAPFFLRHGRVLASFGAIQAMQIFLPLLALPWLARVLGTDAFGILMYMCLIPPLAALFVDWGLALGAGREAANHRQDREALRQLLAAAFSARILLCLACLAIAACLLPFLPYAASFPIPYFLAVCAGIARGMSPYWFYQGAGCGMPLMAAMDVLASLTTLALVFIFIHQADDWPMYLLLLTVTRSCAYGYLMARLWRSFHPVLSFQAGIGLLRKTAALSGSAFSLMLCYNGGQLVLGHFLTAEAMGMIVAVNKMLRALASLVNPFSQTLFPEICILLKEGQQKAKEVLRWSILLTAVLATAAAALAWLAAPLLIRIALGPLYAQAAEILRIALLAAPLMALNNVLANQIIVPFRKEREQFLVQAGCALLTFPLAALLGGCLGVTGGASLPVCTESVMLAGFAFIVCRTFPRLLAGSR